MCGTRKSSPRFNKEKCHKKIMLNYQRRRNCGSKGANARVASGSFSSLGVLLQQMSFQIAEKRKFDAELRHFNALHGIRMRRWPRWILYSGFVRRMRAGTPSLVDGHWTCIDCFAKFWMLAALGLFKIIGGTRLNLQISERRTGLTGSGWKSSDD